MRRVRGYSPLAFFFKGCGISRKSASKHNNKRIFRLIQSSQTKKMDRVPCATIMNFEEVKRVVSSGHLEMLGRSAAQQLEYKAFKDNVLKVEWKSVSDLILVEKFGMDYVVGSDGKKEAVRPFTEQFRKPQTLLLPNPYPYYFEEDVRHFILWKINAHVDESDIQKAMQQLQSSHNVVDICYYINPPHLKSILDIDHAHIVFQIQAMENELIRAAKRQIMTFAEVKHVVSTGNLDVLGRSVQQQQAYDDYRNNVLKVEWKSVSDLILVEKFGMDYVVGSDGKKEVVRPFTEQFRKPQTRLLPNDFPYYFEEDVRHFILWKLNGKVDKLEIEIAIDKLKSEYRIIDICYYINPPHLQSIHDIEHAHIVFQTAS